MVSLLTSKSYITRFKKIDLKKCVTNSQDVLYWEYPQEQPTKANIKLTKSIQFLPLFKRQTVYIRKMKRPKMYVRYKAFAFRQRRINKYYLYFQSNSLLANMRMRGLGTSHFIWTDRKPKKMVDMFQN